MFRKILFLTLLTALLLAGCGPASLPTIQPAPVPTETVAAPTAAAAPVSTEIKLTDGLNRPVVLKEAAQRIVSLAPSNTEILFAVGAGSQVIGRDDFSDYPEEAKSAASVGGSMGKYDMEAITALKPDLVLASELNAPELVKSLEDLGLTVYYLKNPTTLEELFGNLEIVGALTGHDTVKLTDSLKARVAAVDEKIMPLSSHFSVFYEIDATDPAKPYTSGKGAFITLLLERAGGTNIASEMEGYPQMSLEQIVAADPAFIILGDSAYGVTAESVAARPGWKDLSAVKNGQVLPFDDNLVSRPGPRLVDGLEALAKLLRPDLFK